MANRSAHQRSIGTREAAIDGQTVGARNGPRGHKYLGRPGLLQRADDGIRTRDPHLGNGEEICPSGPYTGLPSHAGNEAATHPAEGYDIVSIASPSAATDGRRVTSSRSSGP